MSRTRVGHWSRLWWLPAPPLRGAAAEPVADDYIVVLHDDKTKANIDAASITRGTAAPCWTAAFNGFAVWPGVAPAAAGRRARCRESVQANGVVRTIPSSGRPLRLLADHSRTRCDLGTAVPSEYICASIVYNPPFFESPQMSARNIDQPIRHGHGGYL